MPLPENKFQNLVPLGQKIPGNKALAQFHDLRMQRALDESRKNEKGNYDYLQGGGWKQVVINGEVMEVFARGSGSADDFSGALAPWQALRIDNNNVRIYPSAIYDGLGNVVWCTYNGSAPAIAESYFDIFIPTPTTGGTFPIPGFIYLECTVDDSDDEHGVIVSAEIKVAQSPQFFQNVGDKVNLPLVNFFFTSGQLTIDPAVGFVFTLRRFGPPGSYTWDTQPR